MHKFLLLLLLIPGLSFSQSKKKKLKAEAEANTILADNLKRHVQYLSGAAMTGEQGTGLLLQYLTEQYRQLGIDQAGSSGYLQDFTLDEGKQVETAGTFLKVNDKKLMLYKDYFPLAFSAEKIVRGSPAISLKESGQPWFTDLKEVLEENQDNPHFDMDLYIRREAEKISARGATALLLYNSSSSADNVQFHKDDQSAAGSIPVLYITGKGMKEYCNDITATLNIELGVRFNRSIRKTANVIGFINNHMATTVILTARLDCPDSVKNSRSDIAGIAATTHNNICGTAVLIELARLLKNTSLPDNNNYLIVHYSYENPDFSGSKYWWEHPTKNIIANYMINVDMPVVHGGIHQLSVSGYGISSNDVFAPVTDKNLVVVKSANMVTSKPAGFEYFKNIPVLFFCDHPDDHAVTGDGNSLNYDGEREIVQYICQLIKVTNAKGKLIFTKN